MRLIRRTISLLLLLSLFTSFVRAEGELEAVVTEFRQQYGLHEGNFSLCYRDMVTGEEYRYNDKAFLFAASTYKLPLNVYYYELEQSGELNPNETFGGVRLPVAHEQSMVWSNNVVSHNLIAGLGNFRSYKEKMRKYFTMEDAEIADSYYTGNYYCTAMMLDVLRYVYERREQFPVLLDQMERAQPGLYFKRYAGETRVAHKYGYYYRESSRTLTFNDVGIVYGPHPFLLAVYTQNAPNAQEVLGRVCERLIRYNTEAASRPQPVPEPEPEPEPVPEPIKIPWPELTPEFLTGFTRRSVCCFSVITAAVISR